MNAKRTSLIVAMVVMMSLIVSSSTLTAADKPIELKFAFPYFTTDPNYKTSVDWAKEIEKQSNGRVKITVYPGGALFKGQDTYDSIIKGVADLAFGSFSYTSGRFPMYECLDYVPGYFKSAKATSLGQNAVYAKYKPKEMADVHIFYFIGNTSPRFMTKKPVRALEDLKNMQIRSVGSRKLLIESMGAIPIGMPMDEAYDGLQKGIVEGILTTQETLVSYKLNEVLKYVTDMPTTGSTRFIIANMKVWKSLPPDIQKIFDDTTEKFMIYHSDALDREVKEAVETSVKAGRVQVIKLSPQEEARWVKTMTPIMAAHIETLKSRGLPGKEVFDDLYQWGQQFNAKYPE